MILKPATEAQKLAAIANAERIAARTGQRLSVREWVSNGVVVGFVLVPEWTPDDERKDDGGY